ncbi:MAG: hypothetical protein H6555_03690 [Lewinellaceae bacterium]|nr:hypothetical protein [Lewinellaceae bacterium]
MNLRIWILFSLNLGILPLLMGQDESAGTTPLAIGQWRAHLPYRVGRLVTQSPEKVYYATELSLVAIDKTDGAVEFVSKVDGLTDVGISLLTYNAGRKQLIIAYENSVLDLISENGTVTTLPQIRNFTNIVGAKEIYHFFLADPNTLFIAANYGISRVNLDPAEFAFTTFTGTEVTSVVTLQNYLYAATEEGIYRIRLDNPNPENFGNWTLMGDEQGIPAGATRALAVYNNTLYFDVNDQLYRLDGNQAILVHSTTGLTMKYLTAEGSHLLAGYRCRSGCSTGKLFYFTSAGLAGSAPEDCFGFPNYAIEDQQGRIWFGDDFRDLRVLANLQNGSCDRISFNSPWSAINREITIAGDQVWVAAGGVDQTFSYRFLDHGFASLIDGKWTIYNRFTNDALKGENLNSPADDLFDIMTIAVHPDNGKVYAGSFIEGLLELSPGGVFKLYNEKNSSLNNTVGDTARTRISGLAFDADNNLWIANHLAERPISVLTNKGEWKSFLPACNETRIHQVGVDGNGYKWFVSNSNASGLLVFDEGDLDNPADDRCRIINTGNSNLPTNLVNCLAVDQDGFVWVGTAEGVVIFECGSTALDATCLGERRIVDQDGFLDYLLVTEDVQTIAVDGANRKWVGTKNGVFLLSPDGEETIARFTTRNSPLPSNTINDIAVDPLSGEVFIGTENGIISYRAEAIVGGRVHKASVEVFPNPVRPDYTGPIAIRGLARDAIVKITDISGRLVFETKALGGQAIWDGRDYTGQVVQSGVYLVFSASNPQRIGFGQPDGAVAKIVFIQGNR